MEQDRKIEPSGDRMTDVLENAKLYEACKVVLVYVQDIANNDDTDTEAQTCVKMLESLKINVVDAIGDSIS